MKDEEIIECLDAMSEDEMIENVILPLYKKRFKTFQDIEFSGKDKREDEGIDITYYEIGRETGAKEYNGIQVKQGNINSGKSANGIAAIAVQAQQAFSKPIANIKDKKSYKIQGYTVLTTGVIQAKARMQIVDQFEHKAIRFVDGKEICNWIRENWLAEFQVFCKGPVEEEHEEDDADPIDVVVEFVEKRCAVELTEIRETYNVIDGSKQDILKALMILGHAKITRIAAHVGRKVDYVREDADTMRQEDLLWIDDSGYAIDSLAIAWGRIKSVAEERIEALGYGEEIGDAELVAALF